MDSQLWVDEWTNSDRANWAEVVYMYIRRVDRKSLWSAKRVSVSELMAGGIFQDISKIVTIDRGSIDVVVSVVFIITRSGGEGS